MKTNVSYQQSAISFRHSAAALRRWLAVVFVAIPVGVIARAQELNESPAATQPATEPASRPAVRFAAVDVYVDSKDQPLAAYQFELAAERGQIAIVGIEGGEHAAFKAPPYYDPAALSHNRVVIAAFNTGRDLPKGKTRIARIHLQITGEQEPDYAVKLHVAASADGKQITGAAITAVQGELR